LVLYFNALINILGKKVIIITIYNNNNNNNSFIYNLNSDSLITKDIKDIKAI
jgi:hypothetical protein